MVSSHVRRYTDKVTHRAAGIFQALGFSPTGITALALGVTVGGAVLIASGQFVLGAVVAAGGSLLDAFDGALARRTGRVTVFGGYLDSLADRFADGAIIIAIAWAIDVRWIWAVAMVALLGTLATSYAKARAYQDVRPAGESWPDLLERTERLVILLLGIFIHGLVAARGSDVLVMGWVLVTLAVLTNVTAIQRAIRARRLFAGAGGD